MTDFRTVDVLDAGVQLFELACMACGTVRQKFQPKEEHPNNTIGVQCRACKTLIWLNGRFGPMRKHWGDYVDEERTAAKKSMETYRAWTQQVDAEMFALMPNCPCCGVHDYEVFNVMKKTSCPNCGSFEVDIPSVRDVTNQHYGDDVWWFGPLKV